MDNKVNLTSISIYYPPPEGKLLWIWEKVTIPTGVFSFLPIFFIYLMSIWTLDFKKIIKRHISFLLLLRYLGWCLLYNSSNLYLKIIPPPKSVTINLIRTFFLFTGPKHLKMGITNFVLTTVFQSLVPKLYFLKYQQMLMMKTIVLKLN